MTKTAVLFLDSDNYLGGRPTASVRVWDVPVLKRILIDLQRAGMTNIFLIANRFTDEIDLILNDTRRVNFRRFVVDDDQWRLALADTGDKDAVVLTADRLFDHRFLAAFAAARHAEAGKAFVAVDLGREDKRRVEHEYTPYAGAAVEAGDTALASETEDAGIYRIPIPEIVRSVTCSRDHIRQVIEQYRSNGKIAFFDIGNGFVEVIDSREAVRRAQQRVIRYIWKATDGVHSRFNKRVILPLLKLLLSTPVTPNMISLLGILVSLSAGYFYSLGQYRYALLGGLLAIGSSLLDHVDGCIARIKSKESPFGAHFDTFCDYVFYLSFGIGSTAGLYKASGNSLYIWFVVLLVFGTLVSFVVIVYQRIMHATDPSNYAAEEHKKLEARMQNGIIRWGRKVYFVARRPAISYYLFLFTAINLLPFVLFMTALGTNLFWMFHIYKNVLFTSGSKVQIENP